MAIARKDSIYLGQIDENVKFFFGPNQPTYEDREELINDLANALEEAEGEDEKLDMMAKLRSLFPNEYIRVLETYVANLFKS